jgi:hypothetical protein
MTRTFCDRCGLDITAVKSGRVEGVDDADVDGQGAVSDVADLCEPCYLDFRAWLHTTTALVPQINGSDTGE